MQICVINFPTVCHARLSTDRRHTEDEYVPFSAGKKVILLNLQPFSNAEMFPVVTNTELQDCKINSFQSVSNF